MVTRGEVARYVRKAYAKKGTPPSLGEVIRRLKVSTKWVYRETYQEAGVPVEKAREDRHSREGAEGKKQAHERGGAGL